LIPVFHPLFYSQNFPALAVVATAIQSKDPCGNVIKHITGPIGVQRCATKFGGNRLPIPVEEKYRQNSKLGRIFKVLHLTKSKAIIKSDIEHELSLLDTFICEKKGGKLNMKQIFIDVYETKSPKIHMSNFCKAARRGLVTANAGSKNAIRSESMSINYLTERFSITNVFLEMEVMYNYSNAKICDFVCTMYGRRVGVSVTRAMNYPLPEDFTKEHAYILLKKKLYGLVMSRQNVAEEHSFNLCFLHVWCKTQHIADCLATVYPQVIAEDDTGYFCEVVVLATVYSDNFIFTNPK
jgi:hypothetical protein